ncbi:MAG TPA: hypothetical protein VFW90_04020, partial [Candidatus Saccharimonadales bacterium]|nr:hypothetical protein [Candidatus Saccharimonadales bacterium]
IAMSLSVIAFVAVVVTGATRAYFSDNTSNLTGITFSTGNADLRLSQVCGHSWFDGNVSLQTFNNVYSGCQFNINNENWYPGEEVDGNALYLGNFSASNIALAPTIRLTNYSQTKGGLNSVMEMKIWWYGSATGTNWHPLSYYQSHSVSLPHVPAPSAQPVNQTTGENAGKLGLNFEFRMSPSAGNQYENGTATFDFHFDAAQVH